MKILHLKYKMHKFVNLFFYLIIFGLGFLIGFGAEKINFDKLISQFLFIDSVSALDISTHNSITLNEKTIIEHFQQIDGFDKELYSTIECMKYLDNNYTTITRCQALPTDFFDNAKFREIGTYGPVYDIDSGVKRFMFIYVGNELTTNKRTVYSFTFREIIVQTYNREYFSNFNLSQLDENTNLSYNVLNFNDTEDDTGGDNTGGDNTENDNENTGGDNNDEDVEIDIVNSGFYEFAQKIFGEVGEENKFIYDFITFGLVATCFTLFILIVGYIFNKFFGG